MNDRHPSGTYSPNTSAPDASYGYYPNYGQDSSPSWDTQGSLPVDDDPLFGPLPGSYDPSYTSHAHTSGHDTSGHHATGYPDGTAYSGYPAATTHSDGLGTLYDSGTTRGFDAEAFTADPYGTGIGGYDGASYGTGAYDTGSYDTTGAYGVMPTGIMAQGYDTGAGSYDYDAAPYGTAADDAASGLNGQSAQSAYDGYAEQQWDSGNHHPADPHYASHGQHGQQEPEHADAVAHQSEPEHAEPTEPQDGYAQDDYGQDDYGQDRHDADYETGYDADENPHGAEYEDEYGTQYPSETGAESATEPKSVPAPRSRSNRQGSASAPVRNRRRKAAKRSALLTVAVPSACVMGVAAVAAATVVSPDSAKDDTSESQADDVTTTVASTKLDKQLASLTADADDFADRASRTQERIDLRERQAAEKRRKELEAARKEALRPKFALPVADRGLSAQYGQAGVNWMSLHTGIDFPVSYGTPVLAATDGTVSTKWGGAYGNMAIVTAADGTETWYCHLSTTKIRTGPVKAGDVIAYSGNSGNSTGPHLHFEVHPGGGAAVDPLQWLLSKGLDPR